MSSHVGAKRCFFCHTSTVRGPRRRSNRPVQSYLLTEDYIASHASIFNYAQNLFGDRRVTVQDRICKKCLQRANRYGIRMAEEQSQIEAELAAQQAAIVDILDSSLDASSVGQASDPLTTTPEDISQNISAELLQHGLQNIREQQETPQPRNVPVIAISDYTRISNSTRNCIMAGCHRQPSQTLHRIHLTVRLHALSKHHIYIPHGCRVCKQHLESGGLWNDNFVSLCRSTHNTFNSAQISDMLKILDKKPYIILSDEDY